MLMECERCYAGQIVKYLGCDDGCFEWEPCPDCDGKGETMEGNYGKPITPRDLTPDAARQAMAVDLIRENYVTEHNGHMGTEVRVRFEALRDAIGKALQANRLLLSDYSNQHDRFTTKVKELELQIRELKDQGKVACDLFDELKRAQADLYEERQRNENNVANADQQVKELERLLGLFADLDCCDGYTLGRDEYPKLWDALDEARRILGRGPEEKQTEKRNHEGECEDSNYPCPKCKRIHG